MGMARIDRKTERLPAELGTEICPIRGIDVLDVFEHELDPQVIRARKDRLQRVGDRRQHAIVITLRQTAVVVAPGREGRMDHDVIAADRRADIERLVQSPRDEAAHLGVEGCDGKAPGGPMNTAPTFVAINEAKGLGSKTRPVSIEHFSIDE